MEIEQITEPKEITTILELDDKIYGYECTKTEWVQFLIDAVTKMKDDNIRIYGAKENGKIKGYMVGINCYMPPIHRSFLIMYQTFLAIKDQNERIETSRACLECFKKWSSEFGCHRIMVATKEEKVARLYSSLAGFERTGDIYMKLEF